LIRLAADADKRGAPPIGVGAADLVATSLVAVIAVGRAFGMPGGQVVLDGLHVVVVGIAIRGERPGKVLGAHHRGVCAFWGWLVASCASARVVGRLFGAK